MYKILLVSFLLVTSLFSQDLLNKYIFTEDKPLIKFSSFDIEEDDNYYIIGDIKDNIDYSFGTGSRNLLIFTSPSCPHCQKFFKLSLSDNKLLKTYTINIIMINLSHFKNDKYKIAYLDSKDKSKIKYFFENLEALSSIKEKDINFTKSMEEKLKNNMKLFKELDLNSLPTIIDMTKGSIILSSDLINHE